MRSLASARRRCPWSHCGRAPRVGTSRGVRRGSRDVDAGASRAVAGMGVNGMADRPFVGVTFGGGTTLVDLEQASGHAEHRLRRERRVAWRDRRRRGGPRPRAGFFRDGRSRDCLQQPGHDAHRERHSRSAAAGDRVHASPVLCRGARVDAGAQSPMPVSVLPSRRWRGRP